MHIKCYEDGRVYTVKEQSPYDMSAVEAEIPAADYLPAPTFNTPQMSGAIGQFNDYHRSQKQQQVQRAVQVSKNRRALKSAERDLARTSVVQEQTLAGQVVPEKQRLLEQATLQGYASDFSQMYVLPTPAQSVYRDHAFPSEDWELYNCGRPINYKGDVPYMGALPEVQTVKYPNTMGGIFDDLSKEVDELVSAGQSSIQDQISSEGDRLTCQIFGQNCPPKPPPVPTTSSPRPTTSTITAGMSQQTQKYIMYGGAAVLGLGLLAVMFKAVGSRKGSSVE